MTTDKEVLALHLRSARRMAENATDTIAMYLGDIRRNNDRGEGSSSIARNLASAVADLASAGAVIELLTTQFDLTEANASVEAVVKDRKGR